MAALKRDFDGRATIAIALPIAALGLIGTIVGLLVAPRRELAAYLAAWSAVALVAIGGYCILVIGYAANARWPAVVRRMGEASAGALVAVAALFVPLAIGMARVWPWVDPTPELARAIAHNRGYLEPAWFVVRAIIYFALFVIPAELLRRWSRRRDRAPEPQVPHGVDRLHRERALASAMLPVIGLAVTFAAFDWLMSLQPAWWSGAFGFYVITGSLQAGLALTIVLAWAGVATGAMPLAPAHFRAMGRLLHAFTVLWAYIAYFQAMLIQIANLPREVVFYIDRLAGGWKVVTVVLFVARFVVPFVLLFSRRLKHRAGYVAAISVVILAAHYIDMWWLVVPRARAAPLPSWTDLAALCFVGGTVIAVAARRMRGASLLPVGDPYLDAGLAYESKY
jgi:hypothetical protein